MDALMGLTGACIAAPHVFYAFVWFAPEIWIRLFGERSVERFASVAKAGKGKLHWHYKPRLPIFAQAL